MKTLSPNSKHAAYWRRAYDRSKHSTLEQVYITYSREKGLAYRYCRRQMDEEHGANFKIVSYNSMQFSAGWTTFEGLRIETRDNSYLIPW